MADAAHSTNLVRFPSGRPFERAEANYDISWMLSDWGDLKVALRMAERLCNAKNVERLGDDARRSLPDEFRREAFRLETLAQMLRIAAGRIGAKTA